MNLGEKQELTAVKKVEFGMYLAENPEDETRVLLPAKQVPEGLCIGDKVEIFLYRDSKDRLSHPPLRSTCSEIDTAVSSASVA